MRLTVVSSLLVAVVGLAGCAASEAGNPGAAPSSGAAASATTSTTAKPNRPRALDLTGVDPCATVTDQQRAAWVIDHPPTSRVLTGSLLAGSPSCAFDSNAEQVGFLVITSTTVGLAEFVERTKADPSRQTIQVEKFPAIVEEGPSSAPERGSGECYVDVDVADGQLLEVQFSQLAAREPKRLPVETLCAKARDVAAAALTTLQGG